jgi:sirohydrochlorin cobaltochelatase
VESHWRSQTLREGAASRLIRKPENLPARDIQLHTNVDKVMEETMMMKKKEFFISVCLVFLVVFSANFALAGKHGESKPQKEAILLVAFGTTVPEARKAFDQIESQVKGAFPGVEVRWAFTSSIVRKKLAEQGVKLDPPTVALSKMLEDGFNRVVVASFHTLPGEEFHDLYKDVEAFRNMSGSLQRKILVARPLLSSRKHMEAAIKAMLDQTPTSRKPGDALLLMGHGSAHHPGDAVYAAMNYYAQDTDPNLYISTVEGQPTLEDVVPRLKKKGIKKVYLMPFMAVAGDHAQNDMCGDEKDSWKSILTKDGFEVECVMKGTAENPKIVNLWIENIKASHSHFK